MRRDRGKRDRVGEALALRQDKVERKTRGVVDALMIMRSFALFVCFFFFFLVYIYIYNMFSR